MRCAPHRSNLDAICRATTPRAHLYLAPALHPRIVPETWILASDATERTEVCVGNFLHAYLVFKAIVENNALCFCRPLTPLVPHSHCYTAGVHKAREYSHVSESKSFGVLQQRLEPNWSAFACTSVRATHLLSQRWATATGGDNEAADCLRRSVVRCAFQVKAQRRRHNRANTRSLPGRTRALPSFEDTFHRLNGIALCAHKHAWSCSSAS